MLFILPDSGVAGERALAQATERLSSAAVKKLSNEPSARFRPLQHSGYVCLVFLQVHDLLSQQVEQEPHCQSVA